MHVVDKLSPISQQLTQEQWAILYRSRLQFGGSDKVLLLQGPIGGLFRELAQYIERRGATVNCINFNAGDWLVNRKSHSVNFRAPITHWSDFLHNYLVSQKITRVYLLNDCRPYHRIAVSITRNLGIPCYVFEDGYVRPNFLTLEPYGVNGHSSFDSVIGLKTTKLSSEESRFKPYFWRRLRHGALYSFASSLGNVFFPHYVPYRSISPIYRAKEQLRSLAVKFVSRFNDRKIQQLCTGTLAGRYFFVPLQVSDDTQVVMHSNFDSIEQFIQQTIKSFSRNSSAEDWLVFKHHPGDRGRKDYAIWISHCAADFGVKGRVLYAHELHLPDILHNTKGVVTINSTVGFSALAHETPVITMGRAIYNRTNLCFQGSLDSFWTNSIRPQKKNYLAFRERLVYWTQVNGSFGHFDWLKKDEADDVAVASVTKKSSGKRNRRLNSV